MSRTIGACWMAMAPVVALSENTVKAAVKP